MVIRVHRPTRVLLDAGLHTVEISRAEALRLFGLGVTEEKPIEPVAEVNPEEVKPAAKKRSRKKKTETE